MKEQEPLQILTTGLVGIILVLAISAAIIACATTAFGTSFFLNWVGTFFMCGIPFQIMMGVVWEYRIPDVIGKMNQPIKGICITLMYLLACAIIMPILLFTIGQGELTPIFINYVIQSVGVSLLVMIIFNCWPISKITQKKMMLGLATIVYSYILCFILFKIFYNYHSMEGKPFYDATLDPDGFFDGVTALTFAVTAIAMLLVLVMFEMWPVRQIAKGDSQPKIGLIGTAYVLLVSAVIYYLFVIIIGMERMDFMVRGPVCIIFGAFLVDNMMQFQLFNGLQQPNRGVIKTFICLFGALAMYQLYSMALPFFVGTELPSGPASDYAKEGWVATSMLAITFPVINLVSGAFDFWPLKRSKH